MKEQTTPPAQRIAASYARKSDSNQQALKDQHAVNAMAASRDGFYIPAHLCFEDDDTSGVTTRRKGWDKMMNMAESGDPPFERLYAVKMDRVGR
ncbi:MAG TPA: recombinase family protein [Longimicrobium sp.]|nr:recombinase family protein [Longimicrobium sp.]